MNKQLVLLIITATLTTVKSQIPNSGFEILNPEGTVTNWSNLFLQSGDSIVFDNQLYFSTTDAHSGSRAMEMRNAYYYSTGVPISGRVSASDLPSYGAFNTFVPMVTQPSHFTFYYKFLPAGNDTAIARFLLFDSTANQIGESEIEITSAATTYSLASKVVSYHPGFGPPSFASISFGTAKNPANATFGTHFLVDDVNLSISTGISSSEPGEYTVRCFPNPAQGQLTIELPDNESTHEASIRVTAINGTVITQTYLAEKTKAIKIDVSCLEKGVYFVSVLNNGKSYHSRFIK